MPKQFAEVPALEAQPGHNALQPPLLGKAAPRNLPDLQEIFSACFFLNQRLFQHRWGKHSFPKGCLCAGGRREADQGWDGWLQLPEEGERGAAPSLLTGTVCGSS